MAGRPQAAAKAALALEAIREAYSTPTEPRPQPIPFTPDLPDEALALASIGMTAVEIAAHWAISEETLDLWAKTHSELAEALQRARTRAKAWWTRQPRLAIASKDNKFPAGAWSQQVRALFPEYDDKKGVTVNLNLSDLVRVAIPITPEPLQERVSDAASALIDHAAVGLTPSPTGTSAISGSTADAPCIALPGSDADGGEDPQGAGG